MDGLSIAMITEEEKKLLLKDLSHRLLYGVKLFYYGTVLTTNRSTSLPTDQELIMGVKPYLRRLSSVTEEEEKELMLIGAGYCEYAFHSDIYGNGTYVDEAILAYDWFDEHHIDYRGLIERGLAIEAPEGMY